MPKSVMPLSTALATVLAGSWRKIPPAGDISSAELEAACPSLLQSGGGALAWWKLRNSASSRYLSCTDKLRACYLSYAVHSVQHEREVAQVCHLLRQAGIEAILLKGWAVGRLYADPGLRPAGDIDLCVAPSQKAVAENLLQGKDFSQLNVDLEHTEISGVAGRPFAELLGRSCLTDLNGRKVRVLGAEDHLRALCLHLLKHGAWRPLWLCDIAAAIESRPRDFDWKLCLGENKRHARWILCAVELARHILGASADDVPNHEPLPRWLMPAVLSQWEEPPPENLLLSLPLSRLIHHPREAICDLRRRWHNPIEVTVESDGEFNNWPKFPLQALDGLVRTFIFFARCLAN